MARKQRFSKNWIRAKAKVQKLHGTLANARRDSLHKTSTAISKAQPGKHVKAKSGLNRAILDQGWSEFRRRLEYKQGWLGGMVVAVAPPYTTQLCSCCGHVDAANRGSEERFACVSCRFEVNADLNAARNILGAGHAVLACGEPAQSGRSVKQDPAEATGQKLALAWRSRNCRPSRVRAAANG